MKKVLTEQSMCRQPIRVCSTTVLILLLGIVTTYSQNDICSDAQSFPVLTPGVTQCLSGSTVDATAEIPFTFQSNCMSGGSMASPVEDVWYSFTSVGNLLEVTVSNATMSDISIGFYEGSCSGIIGRGCSVGSSPSHSATFSPVVAGQTYYLQISGGSLGDVGDFDVCVRSYDDPALVCIEDVSMSVSPPPVNGTYTPGQTVNFSVTVSGYNQLAADWFHGLVPVFGNQWDLSTLSPGPPPPAANSNKIWVWHTSVTGTALSAIGPTGPGYFCDEYAPFSSTPEGDPGNNYGDPCPSTGCSWTFTWSISTLSACPPGTDGGDLSVLVENYSDSETGSWNSSSTCPQDPDYLFNATLSCCSEPMLAITPPSCIGNDGGALVTGAGTSPFTFQWSTGLVETTASSSSISGLSAGNYSVEVIDNSGCSRVVPVVIPNANSVQPAISSQQAAGCAGNDGQVVITATGGTPPYQYSLDSSPFQSSGTFTGLGVGTYNVVAEDAAGCTGSISVTINGSSNSVSVTTNTTNPTSCGGTDGSITANASGGTAPYQYSIDNVNFQSSNIFAGLGAGMYTVYVQDNAGCMANVSATIDGNSGSADFSFSSGCVGIDISFTDLSTSVNDPIVSWSWDFGDGVGTSTVQNPIYSYSTENTYNVSLDVTTQSGCIYSSSQLVSIYAKPTTNFSSTTVCEGTSTDFTDMTSISSGSVVGWLWDFGDGSSDNVQNPSYLYASAGNYTVKLVATSDNGCQDSTTQLVVVSPNPVADFSTSSACEGTATDFTDMTSVSSGSVVDWSWDFGDGSSDNVQNPSHLYASAGNYTVKLVATSNNGCQDSTTQLVVVSPNPVADFSASSACEGTATDFTDLTSVSSGSVVDWLWDFGDGTFYNAQNPSHLYAAAGTYSVSLTATSSDGCESEITHSVSVLENPVVNFSNSTSCEGTATDFTDLTSVSSGSVVDWSWDFGDGSSDNVQNPSHLYALAGNYTVKLVTTSDNGCQDSTTQLVVVSSNPVADFSMTSACEGANTDFTDMT